MKSGTQRRWVIWLRWHSQKVSSWDLNPSLTDFKVFTYCLFHSQLCPNLPPRAYHHSKHSRILCWDKRTSQCYSTQFNTVESISIMEGKQVNCGHRGACVKLCGGGIQKTMLKRSGVNAIYRVIERGHNRGCLPKPGWNVTEGRTGRTDHKESQENESFPWKDPPPGHQMGIWIFHNR